MMRLQGWMKCWVQIKCGSSRVDSQSIEVVAVRSIPRSREYRAESTGIGRGAWRVVDGGREDFSWWIILEVVRVSSTRRRWRELCRC